LPCRADTSYGPLEIIVKQMKPSRSFTIRSKGTDTVEYFKSLLADASGIPVETQRLVFSGTCLQFDFEHGRGTLIRSRLQFAL
jgi:hypothetical protein